MRLKSLSSKPAVMEKLKIRSRDVDAIGPAIARVRDGGFVHERLTRQIQASCQYAGGGVEPERGAPDFFEER